MIANKLREGVLIFSLVFIACAALAGYWFPVSLPGAATGVLYGALSAEAYGAIVRAVAAPDRRAAGVILPLIIKLNLFAVFVYILAVSSTIFMYSTFFGVFVVVPASIWAWQHQE